VVQIICNSHPRTAPPLLPISRITILITQNSNLPDPFHPFHISAPPEKKADHFHRNAKSQQNDQGK